MPNIKIDIATQTIEIEQEGEPQVVIIDRAHHIKNYAEILQWQLDEQSDFETDALSITHEIFTNRRNRVLTLSEEQELLIRLYHALKLLRKFPWFNKFIKVIIQGSFVGKYELFKREFEQNIEDGIENVPYEEGLPDWNNTQTILLNFLAYVLANVWPEQASKILDKPTLLDENCASQLTVQPGVDLTDVNDFIEHFKFQLRGNGIEIAILLKETLFSILTNDLFRTELLPIMASAPVYIESFFDAHYKLRDSQLDYWEDVAGDLSDEFDDNIHFNTWQLITKSARVALFENPNDYIEFNIHPGALCTAAGPEDKDFGRHCSRHFNSNDDYNYLMALEVISERCPQYSSGLVVTLDANENILSVKVALRLIANPRFIATVISVREQLLEVYSEMEA